MNTNNIKNKSTKPKQTKKIKRQRRRIGNLLPNNRKKRANIIRSRRIAAASAKTMLKKFTVLRQNGNSVRVTGRDLIYPIPDSLTAPIQTSNVIAVIPANPAYWLGTRIAALAAGYQTYRPIKFKINYIPICAVTQQGNVIGGTVWDDGFDTSNIQQSLRTSNGGFLTQCYVPYSTTIRPKSNLPFNLYKIGGEFNDKTNPFIFIAIAIGCTDANQQRIIPGYFYVTWSFELKNPIGATNTFYNSGLTLYKNIQPNMNNTLVNISTESDIPFGAYIDVEIEQNAPVSYYNDTKIEINENTPVWMFSSVTKTTNANTTQLIPIIYSALTTEGSVTVQSTDTAQVQTITPVAVAIDKGEYYEIEEFEELRTSLVKVADTVTYTLEVDIIYSITQDQIFGVFQSQSLKQVGDDRYLRINYYRADKDKFQLQTASNKTVKPTVNKIRLLDNKFTNVIINKEKDQNINPKHIIEEKEEEEEIKNDDDDKEPLIQLNEIADKLNKLKLKQINNK
jgi:hypothetical protein